MRLLDVGCGWGSLLLYAAEHHGVHATGVTISAQQRDHVEKLVAERGLADRVSVRLQDYREVPIPADGPYDAVSSIEMSEHVGQELYPAYAAPPAPASCGPGGRVCCRPISHTPAHRAAAHSSSATWPRTCTCGRCGETDGDAPHRPGLELRDVESMREHYALDRAEPGPTPWKSAGTRSSGLIGEAGARIWRLYLAGGALTFAGEPDGCRPAAVRPARRRRDERDAGHRATGGRSPEHGLGCLLDRCRRSRWASSGCCSPAPGWWRCASDGTR